MYNDKKKLSLYIHIPFCRAKCSYCDFASYPQKEYIYDKYVLSLLEEIKTVSQQYKDYTVKTVFIGGGTPTVLSQKNLTDIMEKLKSCFNIEENAEITIESNPKTIEYQKLLSLRQAGVNRLSIGLQAWQNKLLKKLGRIYTKEDFLESFALARKAGFDNINLDLMFTLPEQTLEQWEETLKETVSLNPEHISAYSLIIEDGTPFGDMYSQGMLELPDEETDRKMYYKAIEILKENGYNQYEISNFAKKGFESRHNIVYWKKEEYIGLGLGAHSYIAQKRFHNTYDLEKYIHEAGKNCIVEDIEINSINDEYAEFMFLGLRLTEGISVKDFEERFNKSIYDIYSKQIEECVKYGLLYKNEDRIALTSRGIDVSNVVFEKFLI